MKDDVEAMTFIELVNEDANRLRARDLKNDKPKAGEN
jgi:hypothetical protein